MNLGTKYDAKLRIWSGPEQNAELQKISIERSVGEQIFESMKKNSEKICQITHPEVTTITHGEVLNFGIKIAIYLRSLNVTKDEVVGIIAKTSTMMLSIAVGCWLNCTPFFPLSPHSDRSLIAHLFDLTKPKLVFADAEEYEELIEGFKIIKLSPKVFIINNPVTGVPHLNDIFQSIKDIGNFEPTTLEGGQDQTVIYKCSSGTTGIPKCMHVSNAHILAACRSNEKFLILSDLTWLTGITNWINILLSGSTRLITKAPVDSELVFELILKYKINHLGVTPSLLAQMVKCFPDKTRDLTTIRSIISGGSIIAASVIQQACQMLKNVFLYIVYGSTECGAISININSNKPKSVGKLMPGIRVKIVNEIGQHLNVGEIGEILIQNGRNWRGYLGRTKHTASMQDANGWLHTGDLGFFDADLDFFVVGRTKDTLRIRNLIYLPCEIEHIIAELSDVIEVCVVGIQRDAHSECVAAAVIRRNNSRLTELEIEQYVAARVPYCLHLRIGVYFMKDFPKTESGKVMRSAIRDIVMQKNNIYY